MSAMPGLEEIWAGALKGATAAALIFNAAGEVLLVKHSYGMLNWEVPGGAAEPHESPAETAVREVREETRLTVTPERLVGIYYRQRPDGREVIRFAFLCRAAPAAEPQPGEDGAITVCAYWRWTPSRDRSATSPPCASRTPPPRRLRSPRDIPGEREWPSRSRWRRCPARRSAGRCRAGAEPRPVHAFSGSVCTFLGEDDFGEHAQFFWPSAAHIMPPVCR